MIILPDCVSRLNSASSYRKMLHEEIEIKYFYEGTATLRIGTERITARAGDVVVINPYQFHSTIECSAEKGKYHLFMIPLDYFAGSGIEELELRTVLLARNRSFSTLFRDDRIVTILKRIVSEYKERKPCFRVAIRGLVTELFGVLLRQGLVDSPSDSSKNDVLRLYELIEPAINFIRDNYADEITVEKLAEICKVSKYYFCRVFKTVTQKTAMEYVRDYRIDVADIMLCNTEMSVTEISETCGFEDPNYFCRCYKASYGTSPGKRKRNTKIQ